MYALRDRVKKKLSNLFADSPVQSLSPRASLSNSPRARPNSNAERSESSYLTFNVPFMSSKSYQPIPDKPESYDSEENCRIENAESQKKLEDKRISSNRENKQSNINRGNGSGASMRSYGDSDVFEEANEQFSSGKWGQNLTGNSSFISQDLYEFLQSSLPNIVKGCKWVLLYSSLKHGISLRTLIRKSAQAPGPCLLIAGDMKGAVFGAMLECPLTPTPKRKYQGTNQTFVFTTIYGEPRLFRPTGANRYYYMCMADMLALGGGGNFALSLDGDLLSGSSGACDTFGNECLAHSAEFELKNVELWGFAHSSRYTS